MLETFAAAATWLQAGALAIACCAGEPSAAQAISAADPAGVADALRDLGYRARLEADEAGDPVIESAIEGVSYDIFFYGCEGGTGCRSLLFSAAFGVGGDVSLSRINEWNRDRLLGRAFLDEEGNAVIDHFAPTVGGLSRANFADMVEGWGYAIADFTDHIGW